MQTRVTRLVLATFAVMGFMVGAPLAIGTAQDASTPAASPEATVGVVREVLSSDDPESAPGEELALVRYTIPAGAVLAVHVHPGVQMATVESGVLTYHVVEGGSVPVTRADGTEEMIGPGESTTFEAGDAWVEPEGMVHYGENLTDEPVVLTAASLLADDEPPAIPVDVATPAT